MSRLAVVLQSAVGHRLTATYSNRGISSGLVDIMHTPYLGVGLSVDDMVDYAAVQAVRVDKSVLSSPGALHPAITPNDSHSPETEVDLDVGGDLLDRGARTRYIDMSCFSAFLLINAAALQQYLTRNRRHVRLEHCSKRKWGLRA